MTSRRHFLKTISVATAGAVAGPIVIACGGGGPGQSEARGTFSAGNVDSLSVGHPIELGEPVVVVLDSKGLYAMSTICTHQQCDMRSDGSVSSSGLDCYCHGSRFSITGAVEQGPARSPLRHFAVQVDASGDITVDASHVVSANTRTPVST
jgi:Rieske Fe-S protein